MALEEVDCLDPWDLGFRPKEGCSLQFSLSLMSYGGTWREGGSTAILVLLDLSVAFGIVSQGPSCCHPVRVGSKRHHLWLFCSFLNGQVWVSGFSRKNKPTGITVWVTEDLIFPSNLFIWGLGILETTYSSIFRLPKLGE